MSQEIGYDNLFSRINYTIEGVITELSLENNDFKFEISGTEGYSLKFGKDRYNVLIVEDIYKIKDRHFLYSFIVPQSVVFQFMENSLSLLAVAMTSGKRVMLTGETSEEEIKKGHIKVSSITLLND